jgi:hypothetical protein
MYVFCKYLFAFISKGNYIEYTDLQGNQFKIDLFYDTDFVGRRVYSAPSKLRVQASRYRTSLLSS